MTDDLSAPQAAIPFTRTHVVRSTPITARRGLTTFRLVKPAALTAPRGVCLLVIATAYDASFDDHYSAATKAIRRRCGRR